MLQIDQDDLDLLRTGGSVTSRVCSSDERPDLDRGPLKMETRKEYSEIILRLMFGNAWVNIITIDMGGRKCLEIQKSRTQINRVENVTKSLTSQQNDRKAATEESSRRIAHPVHPGGIWSSTKATTE